MEDFDKLEKSTSKSKAVANRNKKIILGDSFLDKNVLINQIISKSTTFKRSRD
jgi:hypothetical protein